MKYIIGFTLVIFFNLYVNCQNSSHTHLEYVLIIHGGAGNFNSAEFSEEKYNEYYSTLNRVLEYGDSLLRIGSSSVDVVTACITLLEDSPLFNAGKGSVFNEKGYIEMDASVMDGSTLSAGAVAGVKTIKNPIKAAYLVMKDGKHVLLGGEGAEKFAKSNNLEIVSPSYFHVQEVYDNYLKQKKEKGGTVGAVALDRNGNLAAGTSTGGMMMKREGRIGDSPIIGAATYADNNCCAVSTTGHGEFFIRFVVAYDICALMKYSGMNLDAAAEEVIQKIGKAKGKGGVIALDKEGNAAISFNTLSMYRGMIKSTGEKLIEF